MRARSLSRLIPILIAATALAGSTPVAEAVPCYYFQTWLIDPVKDLLAGAAITTNRTALSTQGREVIGVAADGTAKVLIRVKLNVVFNRVPVEFSLEGTPGTTGVPTEDGSLSSVDAQDTKAVKVTVQSDEVNNQQWAFAIYNAPMDFVRNGTADDGRKTRDLVIKFRVNNDQEWCTIPVQIHRPLVYPVHGIWSSYWGTWTNFAPLITNGAIDPRFTLKWADYQGLTQKPIAQTAALVGNWLPFHIEQDKKARNIAAVQVDLVAHSLGGLVCRALPTHMRHLFVRPDNYNKGDAHKLITIGTPHMGSRIASQMERLNVQDRNWYDRLELAFANLTGVNDPLSGGAVRDLAVGSPMLNNIGVGTSIPEHHIVGQANAAQLASNAWFDAVLRYAFTRCPPLLCPNTTGFGLAFGTQPHDIFIEQPSQKGGGSTIGIGTDARLFQGVVHSTMFTRKATVAGAETRSAAISQWVIDLLNKPVRAPEFKQANNNLLVPETETDFLTSEPPDEAPAPAAMVVASSPVGAATSAIASATTAAGGIAIVSPVDGAIVHAGDNVTIEVQATGGVTLVHVLASTPGATGVDDTAPFRVDLEIPDDAVGSRGVGVLGVDQEGNPYVASIGLTVRVAAALTSLTALTPTLTLPGPGLDAQATIVGMFADGVARDVTLDPATTYTVGDPIIATIDGGRVSARRQGATTIIARNGSFATSITVTVESSTSVPLADLEITHAAPAGPLAPGSSITYTIGVTNRGPAEAIDVIVGDLLPETTTFVSCAATGGAVCDGVGNSRTMSVASLASGAAVSMTLVATIDPTLAHDTTIVNMAHAAAATIDPVVGDNSASASTVVHAVPPPAPPPPPPPAPPSPEPPSEPVPAPPTTAAFTRYFAEGATGTFFDCAIALLNPGTSEASVLLHFLKDDATTVSHALTIPAGARRTVYPETLPGLESASFSTVIESDVLVVADRTMTWGQGNGVGGYGSHAETAIAAPSTSWYLAEGATGGPFQLFYLLQNANTSAATVTIRFLRQAGAPIARDYTLPPSSRTTISVNDVDPALNGTDVSAAFASTLPIIVERAMYLNRPGEPFSAGHESAGVTAPATHWFLAEGATGPFFDLYVLLANPSDQAADVEMRYLTATGEVFTNTRTLAPNSRTTVWVDQETFSGAGQALANAAVSTLVTSINGVPIIVERAMWWPDGQWYEAHNSPGATETGTAWALADGEVGGSVAEGPAGVQTYVLIANTSTFAGSARVTLHFEDGTTAVRIYALSPTSRTNVPVGADFPDSAGKRFGVIVESLGEPPAELVVERAMYSHVAGVVWAAGTNVVATKLR